MRRHVELLIFVSLFVAYNINLRQVSSHDTYASRFVPISILRDGDVILDEFVPEELKQQAGDDFYTTYFYWTRGHFYDSHPPVGPLLALPVFALPVWTGMPARAELVANLFSKLAASLMVALSGVLIFLVSRQVLLPTIAGEVHDTRHATRMAVLAALTYGLATNVWSTASLSMWTHTPAVLGFAAMLWGLTTGRFALAGIAAAAACIARPATAPGVALLGLYLLHRAWRDGHTPVAARRWMDVLRFSGAGLITGLAGAAYNQWLFHHLLGGAPFRSQYWYKLQGTTGMFDAPMSVGLAGLTVSPNRGILIFSPIVLAAVYGAVRAWRMPLGSDSASPSFGRADALLFARYSSLAALAVLLTYSKSIYWWAGHGWGPRYLTDAMPFIGPLFALGFSPIFARTSRARVRRIAVAAALSYSVFIQAVGAFCWPSSWTLNDNPPYQDRLWDWRESDIVISIREGAHVDPAARALFRRLGL